MKTSLLKVALLICITASSANAKENNGVVHRSGNPTPQTGTCPNTTAQMDLDINNIRVRILNGGDMWWDPISQTNYYEVPKGSGKNSLYTGAIWIGGYDAANALKVAAQTYRQQGANDFWAGPISKDAGTGALSVTNAVCGQYDRFWKLTKQEVQTFISGGNPSQAIIDWPGNGNVSNGELQFLAPFFDANNDGVYDYTQGDYPNYNFSNSTGNCNDYIFGDQTIWWVFNDIGNIHTETNSDPIGLEIRAQAFAYSSANPNINNATFYKYQIINRSNETYSQCRIGQWVDPDLGNAADDYVGCDVARGLGFCYNSDPDDEGASGYGLNPPAVGTDFLQGPIADVGDGIDNNMNWVTDEPGEECTMSKFLYYKNINNSPFGNPALTADYYSYLSGRWLNGFLMTHGGDGYTNQSNPPCSFMFPGNTDPAFTDDWTMATAGISPNDMRYLQSAGTFTLDAGEVDYVTITAVWARDTAGPISSLIKLEEADDDAQVLFNNCFVPAGIKEVNPITNVNCSPNPSAERTIIRFNNLSNQTITLQVYDMRGNLVRTMQTSGYSFLLERNELNSGVYLYRLMSENKMVYSGKIVME